MRLNFYFISDAKIQNPLHIRKNIQRKPRFIQRKSICQENLSYIGSNANAHPDFDLPFLQFFFILILHLFKNYL